MVSTPIIVRRSGSCRCTYQQRNLCVSGSHMTCIEWAARGVVNESTSLSVQFRSSSSIRLFSSSRTVGRLTGERVGVSTGQYSANNSGVSWTTNAGQAHQSFPFKTPRTTMISPGAQRATRSKSILSGSGFAHRQIGATIWAVGGLWSSPLHLVTTDGSITARAHLWQQIDTVLLCGNR